MESISIVPLNIVVRDVEPTDEHELLRLFLACEDWFEAATGQPSMPADVQSLYYALPEGAVWEDKRLLTIDRGGVVIGVVDAVLHHPGTADCAVGLFLVHPEHRLQSVGRSVADALVRRLLVDGFRRVSTSTPAGWEPGESFLKSLGFTRAEELDRPRAVNRSGYRDGNPTGNRPDNRTGNHTLGPGERSGLGYRLDL